MPWRLPEDDAGLLALAKGYPYQAPARSYLLEGGEAAALGAADFADRVPVIAHGSNRSPAHLRRKFGTSANIPVTLGRLADYDVVYSAHITQYGAVASTLQHRPGLRVRVAVTWLDPAQLARMHETEGPSNYAFGRLSGIALSLEDAPAPAAAEAFLYLGRNGCLDHDGQPIGLAASPADGRGHLAHDQEGALGLVRDRHRPHMGLDEMILDAIRNPERRSALTAEMRARAVPPAAPHFEELGM